MSSHPGGRKTPSCLLTGENGKREFVRLACVTGVKRGKGWEGRGGGRGGVIKFNTMGLVED